MPRAETSWPKLPKIAAAGPFTAFPPMIGLIAAIGALLGPLGLLFVLFWMALAGGLLSLVALARGQRDYACGPAIALGYLAYLIWPTGVLQRLVL